jgi:pyruvate formate lyase activating enzyme
MVPAELTGGYIFDIQGFSVHDGPGCRTLIFLKGCSLRCKWCSNPEGLHSFPEPLYNSEKCIFDNLCIEACPKDAITPVDARLAFNQGLCRNCFSYDCVAACCTGALKIGGYFIRMVDLYKLICRDRQYWGSSGGITLTGGEPFLQPDFAESILKTCYEAHIHTAVETCGNVPWDNIERSLDHLDFIFYDLKHMDREKHKASTGSDNKLILQNARLLASRFTGRLVFRLPLVPGFNDDDAHIQKVSDFLHRVGKDEINILPVHHLGREKYALLGLKYFTSDFTPPGKEIIETVQTLFQSNDIRCYIGSDTPF